MKKTILHKLIAFCIGLLIVRMLYTSTFSFSFLTWNLFLAWLPVYFCNKAAEAQNKYVKILLLMLTVLFLPNAPYIITDLFHLKKPLIAPVWMDVLLILSFAIVGLIYFLVTVKKLLWIAAHQYEIRYMQKWLKAPLMVLTSYGIYLGRFLRFNSWDVVTNPVELISKLCNSFMNLSHYKETLAITLSFSVFLFLIYELFDNLQSEKNEKYSG